MQSAMNADPYFKHNTKTKQNFQDSHSWKQAVDQTKKKNLINKKYLLLRTQKSVIQFAVLSFRNLSVQDLYTFIHNSNHMVHTCTRVKTEGD